VILHFQISEGDSSCRRSRLRPFARLAIFWPFTWLAENRYMFSLATTTVPP
jgi:hypothetical protein